MARRVTAWRAARGMARSGARARHGMARIGASRVRITRLRQTAHLANQAWRVRRR